MTPQFIIQAAINSATNQATKNQIENIIWASSYAEPGYSLTHPERQLGIYLSD